jgi:hypothetical protein
MTICFKIYTDKITIDNYLIQVLIDESNLAMTNERVAKMHAQAQFGFIDDTIDASIAALAGTKLNTKLDYSNTTRAYTETTIAEVATLFEFEGVPMIQLISLIQCHLWPFGTENMKTRSIVRHIVMTTVPTLKVYSYWLSLELWSIWAFMMPCLS